MPEQKPLGTLKIFRRDEPVFVDAGERPDKEPNVLIGECSVYKIVHDRLKIGDWQLDPAEEVKRDIEESLSEIESYIKKGWKSGSVSAKYEWVIEVDTRDEKCRKCGGLLFKVVPLPPDGKYWAHPHRADVKKATFKTESLDGVPD